MPPVGDNGTRNPRGKASETQLFPLTLELYWNIGTILRITKGKAIQIRLRPRPHQKTRGGTLI